MKKYFLYAVSGISVGELFGLVFSLFFSYLYNLKDYVPSAPTFTDHFSRPLNAVLVSVILWGMMGLVFNFGALIFNIEDWSILKRTIVNFIIYYCGFTPLAILAGWFPLNLINWLVFTGIFVMIYLIMWFINFYAVKQDLKKINRKLRQ
ncbi:DUF3021 domain-containing protein [Limosilactobacillus sp. RRLNB_1_1]|uniref:DUF3021 domain-containing protein n=1 Tax=Limosilactobacillus albertensis TaxID=2759752 RepID=A0A7W3Y7Y3_9LACO|nr:DUF3021 domain-containing protein [Limosilactobacillus albertensis]MBB1068892.1 DUF3021 domain-containing protein [Limosilactobacillus albertensis]MCD7118652.1 DUF3021 domain-containing protein [Limosilactobacillus albertensis]MCD7128199.1 DUF3021 domain-containing protein [Limosilactobacillus albertensis]